MAAKARPKNPILKHKFVGRIGDKDIAWFSKIGGFASELEIAEAHEGGNPNFAWDSPGKRKFSPLEVMVAASDNRDLHDLHEQAAAAAGLDGVPDDDYKVTFSIDVYRVGSKKIGRWVFEEAWVSKYTPGEFDGSTTGFLEETATIKYRQFRWEPAT
jgi:phage tail-like protein